MRAALPAILPRFRRRFKSKRSFFLQIPFLSMYKNTRTTFHTIFGNDTIRISTTGSALLLWVGLSMFLVDHESTQHVNFLDLNEEKKMMLLPLLSLHKESPFPGDSMSNEDPPLVCSVDQFPLAKWVHICCEVSINFVRIHMDGKIVGENSMEPVLEKSPNLKSSSRVILAANFGDNEGLQGYVHDAEVLYLLVSVKDQHMKVVASLVYNDNHAPVDKSEVGEYAAYIEVLNILLVANRAKYY